jgi:hypothetical protein
VGGQNSGMVKVLDYSHLHWVNNPRNVPTAIGTYRRDMCIYAQSYTGFGRFENKSLAAISLSSQHLWFLTHHSRLMKTCSGLLQAIGTLVCSIYSIDTANLSNLSPVCTQEWKGKHPTFWPSAYHRRYVERQWYHTILPTGVPSI